MIAFRDETARRLGLELLVHTNQEGRARHQPDRLGLGIAHRGDEDRGAEAGARPSSASTPRSAGRGATRRRAAPRSASSRSRSAEHGWDPKNQRPELWRLYNTRLRPGEVDARLSACPTGPSSTSGNTSPWKKSRSCRFISPRGGRWSSAAARWIMVDDDRLPLAARRRPRNAPRPFPHPGLLPADRRDRIDGDDTERHRRRNCADRARSERQGRLIDSDEEAADGAQEARGLFLMAADPGGLACGAAGRRTCCGF